MSTDTVAIIQARLGSSRLPGKVLLDICGEPMLARVVTRVGRAHSVAKVVVATTIDSADDEIATFCGQHGIPFTRGSQFDVLDRYYQAARAESADIVIRITADCPVIDPSLIDDVVGALTSWRGSENRLPPAASLPALDFAANRLPPPWKRTFPIGLDTEACTFEALARAWHEAREPQEREHVMPFIYEGVELGPMRGGILVGVTPRGFRIALLGCGQELGHHRWTVDTAEDLEFVRRVYLHFRGQDDFTWQDVLALVNAQPDLMRINAGVRHNALEDIDKRAPGLGST